MPFGESLQKLVKTSPEFSLDKVRMPLLLTSEEQSAAIEMWQPYASLRSLRKTGGVRHDQHPRTRHHESGGASGVSGG